MLKLGQNVQSNDRDVDIRDREMDMSPKSSKNDINFHNHNYALKNQK